MNKRLITSLTAVVAALATPIAARADVVTDWNETLIATLAGQTPFAQARFAAITHLAVFEAVNAITSEVRPLPGHRLTAPAGASRKPRPSWRRTTCWSTTCRRSAVSLARRRDASLAAIPDGQPRRTAWRSAPRRPRP